MEPAATRSVRPPAALLVLAVLAASCSGRATSVHLIVDAEPAVRDRAASLRVAVSAGQGGDRTQYRETRPLAEIGWPADVVAVPRSDEPGREATFEVAALDARGAVVSRGAGTIAFVRGEERVARLVLALACSAAPCAPILEQDLDAAVAPARDSGELPPGPARADADARDGDPPAADAGLPPRDGGPAPHDAGSRRDDDPPRDASPRGADSPRDASPRDDATQRDDDPPRDADPDDTGPHDTDPHDADPHGADPRPDGGPPPPACAPAPETCDGRDEDCDGRTDESLTRACGDGERDRARDHHHGDHDDDHDVDEHEGAASDPGAGCRQVCAGGAWGRCERADGERCRR